MNRKNIKRKSPLKSGSMLIPSIVMAMTASALLAGATYALFTDSSSVPNHLEAGTLKITLLRTKLEKVYLADDGSLKTKVDENEKDFSKSKENVFDLLEGEKAVPGCLYQASMRIVNGKKNEDAYKRSSVAFSYSVSLILSKNSDPAFASQLTITIGQGTFKETHKLSEFGTDPILVGSMTPTDMNADFYVKAEFDDLKGNNDAQGKNIWFDLAVKAVQSK